MPATRYERETGYRTLETADSECVNCGIGLTESPKHDGVHAIRMLYHTEGDEHVCEACFFESYERSGRQIAERELCEFYEVRRHRDGEPEHHYDRYWFETPQAASGWVRANGGEYLGKRTKDPFKLKAVDE